jgi:hypothetical protein
MNKQLDKKQKHGIEMQTVQVKPKISKLKPHFPLEKEGRTSSAVWSRER